MSVKTGVVLTVDDVRALRRERVVATIKNEETGEMRELRRYGSAAPVCLQYSGLMCGYWESRLELFEWACGAAGFDPTSSVFVDGYTGEVLDIDDLEEEYLDEIYSCEQGAWYE